PSIATKGILLYTQASHDRTIYLPRISWPPATRGYRRPASSRPVRNARFPGALGRTYAAHAARELGFHAPWRGRIGGTLDVGRIRRAAPRECDGRHPLRHEMVQARHDVGGSLGGRAARGGRRARSEALGVRARDVGRRLYHQPAAGGRDGWQGVGGGEIRRRAARARARRARASAGASPLL